MRGSGIERKNVILKNIFVENEGEKSTVLMISVNFHARASKDVSKCFGIFLNFSTRNLSKEPKTMASF